MLRILRCWLLLLLLRPLLLEAPHARRFTTGSPPGDAASLRNSAVAVAAAGCGLLGEEMQSKNASESVLVSRASSVLVSSTESASAATVEHTST